MKAYSVQSPGYFSTLSSTQQAITSVFNWSLAGKLSSAPVWWSKRRDDWLATFPKWEGNDLLGGATSTLIAKIASTNFFLEGPRDLVNAYMPILTEQADFGRGWESLVSKLVESYLCRDGGGVGERLRTSAHDIVGPAAGFAHLDESKCYFSNDPDYPVSYETPQNRLIKMHRAQVFRMVDMPSPREDDLGVGFCSVSRSLTTAQILMDLVKYKRERLSDLPPAGILFINNMTEGQWGDIVRKYDTRQRNEGNTVWRDILVAVGLDPEYQVGAELMELSKLWETYDEAKTTEIAIFTFALAFRVDPREFWPVSAGSMGTATEAKLQHLKAKSKGEGIIFSAIERIMNNSFSLPPEVHFKFDYHDVDEATAKEEARKVKIENIRRMWESSPNRQALTPAASSGRPASDQSNQRDPSDNPQRPENAEQFEGPNPPVQGPANTEAAMPVNEGMITTQEARMLLAQEGLIPPDFVSETPAEKERVYAIRNWGPYIRKYNTGDVEWLRSSGVR